LWDHRHAVETLRQQGRRQIGEGALFDAIEQMRAITATAAINPAARKEWSCGYGGGRCGSPCRW
jgi:putative transposase